MYLVKGCHVCGRKLRFPIDRGKIRVSCPCGYSFAADPDDPALYEGARFDIHPDKGARPRKFDSIGRSVSRFIGEFPATAIRFMLRIKYKVQNFRILPSSEQRKMIILAAILVLLVGVLVFLICDFRHAMEPADSVI